MRQDVVETEETEHSSINLLLRECRLDTSVRDAQTVVNLFRIEAEPHVDRTQAVSSRRPSGIG